MPCGEGLSSVKLDHIIWMWYTTRPINIVVVVVVVVVVNGTIQYFLVSDFESGNAHWWTRVGGA